MDVKLVKTIGDWGDVSIFHFDCLAISQVFPNKTVLSGKANNMSRHYSRKDFLRLAMLGNLALLSRPLHGLAVPAGATTLPLASNSNVTYYRKGDAAYESLRKGFNKRIDKYPAVIALCRNTAGVAEAVRYAAQNGLPVAVKSGGHCMEGFSCNNDGMVINLSPLNTIEWVDDWTVKLGPACTLSQLYNELLPKGKVLPGGSCAGVAIGGLTLGGGYGLMARLFGLTCDSLLQVTMVDGTGQVVESANDPELLWACRGGGNGHFGVATELVFKVHKAPARMQSFRFKAFKLTAPKAYQLLQQWFAITEKLPPACFSAFVLNGKTGYILLTNVSKHTEAVKEAVTALSALVDKTTQTKPTPLATALKVFYGRTEPLYFKNASAGLYKGFADIAPFAQQVLETVVTTPGMIYQVNTLGGNIVNPANEAVSAFAHRAYPYFSELQTYWDVEKQGGRLMQRFAQVQQLFAQNGITAQYRNYPDIEFKGYNQAYYGNNYPRLQAVKKKYDPQDTIRHAQSIALPG
jgi:FAD/FMN-containing dehydrogenase